MIIDALNEIAKSIIEKSEYNKNEVEEFQQYLRRKFGRLPDCQSGDNSIQIKENTKDDKSWLQST